MSGPQTYPGRYNGVVLSILHGLYAAADGKSSVGLAGDISLIWRNRLCRRERGFLHAIACLAVEDDGSSWQPVPEFLDRRTEARDWALFAETEDRRAYLAAIWSQLQSSDRADFLKAATVKQKVVS